MASLFHYSLLAICVLCVFHIKQTSSQSPDTQAWIDRICANSAHYIPADYLFCQDFFEQNNHLIPNADIHGLNQIIIWKISENATIVEKTLYNDADTAKSYDLKAAEAFGICDDHYNKVISEYDAAMDAFNKGDFKDVQSHENNCPPLMEECKRLVEPIQSLQVNKFNVDMVRLITMSQATIQLLIDS